MSPGVGATEVEEREPLLAVPHASMRDVKVGVTENPAFVLLARIGAPVVFVTRAMGDMGIFMGRTLAAALTPPLKFGLVMKRVDFFGFQSLVIILLTGLFTGMVLGYQGYYTLARVGSTAFLGPMVALALLRELGPVIGALMVTARAGSAVCAEVGIKRINEEIDALKMMGVNPFRYLFVPVLLAAVFCMPLLTAVFNVIGIAGGYMVGVRLLNVEAATYFGQMTDYVKIDDITAMLYKSLAFGAVIAWVSCWKGFRAGYGAEGVSRATTQAVVLTSVLILVVDYFLTSVLF
jgi:phospholipid/cholesterol/gamma-HCH transport system permease protein